MPINREDPEVQELINKETDALAAKNRELLTELRAAKAKAKGADIDPAEHSKLQDQVDELTSKLRAAETKSKTEIEKLTKLASEKDGALTSYLVDAELANAITASGIAAHYAPAVKALFKGQTAVETVDGKHTVKLDDKPLAEALKAWATSDDGRHYVSAQNNAGGGAAGNNTGKGAGSKKFSELSSEEKVALYRADPTAYEAAKKQG